MVHSNNISLYYAKHFGLLHLRIGSYPSLQFAYPSSNWEV